MRTLNGKTIWITGLSASGKSTLSSLVKVAIEARGIPVVVLDGDILRSGLNRDLGFSAIDRMENIRRAAEVARLLAEEGHTVLSAFITPLESIRRAVRSIHPPDRYVEIYLDCPLSVCETRDPKGLYRRAKNGEIPEFTGISAPFEEPAAPDLRVHTAQQTIPESVQCIVEFLEHRFPDLKEPVRSPSLSRAEKKKVFVLGLDSVPPAIAFGNIGRSLPNLKRLMDHGSWGPLQSTDPPITLPSWTTITTGRDPGELGIYGFRNRAGYTYDDLIMVDSSHVRVPRVWEHLETYGKSSILIGIPQTHPPRPHNGITVSDFHAPGVNSRFTYPDEIGEEVHRITRGQYLSDVKSFRNESRDGLLDTLYAMVKNRFLLAGELLASKPWDFFMMVEMATDRLHHCFWRYWAADHRLHEPGNRFSEAIPDFYQYLDSWIGSLLALLSDDTTVMVVSDHGVRNMEGAVAINEWLIEQGLLTLHEYPSHQSPLSPAMIDWSRTTAWGEGGYYARIFLNVKGREPLGLIEPDRYHAVRDDLAARLEAIPGETGLPMDTRVLKPEEIYRSLNSTPPDLIVYFDGLRRRSAGTVGCRRVLQEGNDTGPDDVNHDHEGICIITRMGDLRSGMMRNRRVADASVMDIAPTIINEFGFPLPPGLGGKVIAGAGVGSRLVPQDVHRAHQPHPRSEGQTNPDRGYTPEEEEIVKKRLEELGYI